MTIYEIIGVLSGVVFASSVIPYIISIMKGKSTPHPVSWVLWAILGAVTFYFSIKLGAQETLPLAFFNFATPCLIAILSIKYWSKGAFSRFDYICLVCSLSAIVTYILFRNAAFSLTLNLLGDFFAYLPTLRKTYFDPGSENLLAWGLVTIGYVLSIVAAIPRFTYGIAIFPIYLTIFGIIMCCLIFRGRLKKAQ